MEHDPYIKVYDDALDINVTKNILELSKDIQWERWDRDGRPQFDQFNLTEYVEKHPDSTWAKVHARLVDAIKTVSNQYMDEVKCQDNWPRENALEQIRLKRYSVKKEDRFDPHVDVGDHNSARRFLALFFYVNDVDKGGETWFTKLGLKVKPEAGKCLLFPPTWTYPHAGLPPASEDKLIIGTYLHYI